MSHQTFSRPPLPTCAPVVERLLSEEHARIIETGPKTFHPGCPDHAAPLTLLIDRVTERLGGAVSRHTVGHVLARGNEQRRFRLPICNAPVLSPQD